MVDASSNIGRSRDRLDGTDAGSDRTADPATVQLAEETVDVTTREVITDRVRVSTRTEILDHVVRQELEGVRAEVVRVPVDRMLEPGEAPPVPRAEGDVTIIPIFEEVLTVEKRLLLKEELHITQYATVEEVELPVTLRRQQAVVERTADHAPDNSSKD